MKSKDICVTEVSVYACKCVLYGVGKKRREKKRLSVGAGVF